MDNKKVSYRQATKSDCVKLAPLLRDVDKRELHALYGAELNSCTVLEESLKNSLYCFSGFCDGEIIGMFGIGGNVLSGNGIIWLLSSDKIKKFNRELLTQSKQFIAYSLNIYTSLSNIIDCRNKINIRFLKHLGFQFSEKIIYNHQEFYPFSIKRGEHK